MLNSPPAPILIGREGQLTVLRAFSARVASGRAGALLLRGDAGGGKTRLVTELASEARAAGTTVLAGGCVALGDEPLRHAALIELLRAAMPSGGAEGPASAVAGLPTEQVLGALARGRRRGATHPIRSCSCSRTSTGPTAAPARSSPCSCDTSSTIRSASS